jgi:hypothetical protein
VLAKNQGVLIARVRAGLASKNVAL